MMLDTARKDPSYEGHVTNTASMAGMVNMPNMGSYNVTKNAVVAMSETLFQDLSLVTDQVHCSVLCPFFVPTGIVHSDRLRPAELGGADVKPTKSQLIAKALGEKAVASGKLTAANVAQMVIDAVASDTFYVFSHPHALGSVQTRLEDIMLGRNPSDPFKERPQIGQQLRDAIRSA
jgi:short-subunit dehydrogenase